MKSIYVIDTSALLSDPDIIFCCPDAEIIIPQTVLAELDRLKVSRADRGMIYRGREVSRMLFSLAKRGKLTDGITTKENAVIKVMSTDHLGDIPQGLNLKNADDVILALAHQVTDSNPLSKVVLVTSDLNMMLRAQTLDVAAERIEEKPMKKSFRRRLKEEKLLKVMVGIISVLIILGGVSLGYYYWAFLRDTPSNVKEQDFLKQEETYKGMLRNKPDNVNAMVTLAGLYYANGKYAEAGVYYHKALLIAPDDVKIRTEYAAVYIALAEYDNALKQISRAMDDDPQFAPAYYYAGLAYEKKGANPEAIEQYKAYLELDQTGQLATEAKQAISRLD